MSDLKTKGPVPDMATTLQLAAAGVPIPGTGDLTGRILSMAMAAEGSEKIDPDSLVSGREPRLLPAAKPKV